MKALNWKRLFAVLVACTFVFAACGMDNSPTPMPNPTVTPPDSDGDGLSDTDEINAGLDPYNAFTDGKTIDNQNPSWLMQHPEYGLALAAVLNAVAQAIPSIGGKNEEPNLCTYDSAIIKESDVNETDILKTLIIKDIKCTLEGYSVNIGDATYKLTVKFANSPLQKVKISVKKDVEPSKKVRKLGTVSVNAMEIKVTKNGTEIPKISHLPLTSNYFTSSSDKPLDTSTKFTGICKFKTDDYWQTIKQENMEATSCWAKTNKVSFTPSTAKLGSVGGDIFSTWDIKSDTAIDLTNINKAEAANFAKQIWARKWEAKK